MKYRLNFTGSAVNVNAPVASGYDGTQQFPFVTWQPSTWPEPPTIVDSTFIETLKRIFEESILYEIKNVIEDAERVNSGLEHRGHVIALAMLCAVDTISSYAFPKTAMVCSICGRGDRIGLKYQRFIFGFFPEEYKCHAKAIYQLHRNNLVHRWNLFSVAILSGNEPILETRGALEFGLKNFFDALVLATERFLDGLENDVALQKQALARYTELKNTASPRKDCPLYTP